MVINVVEWCAAKGSVQDPAGRGHQGSRPRHARALGRVGRGSGVPAERRALFRHHRRRPGDLQRHRAVRALHPERLPPATRQGLALAASTRTSAVVVSSPSGTAGATISLRVLQPLPGDVSLNGYDGGVPEISPFAPAPMTVQGCGHGLGVVTIQTTNSQTGKASTLALPMVESPSGSGRYSVTIPPLWPVHGPSTVSYHIYCVGAIVPKAGPATGGNLVAIHGTGFNRVTAVMFGTKPSPRFKVVSGSVIEATAPPGAGAVGVRVRTAHGSTPGGFPGAYTYISLRSLAPSSAWPPGRHRYS